MVDRDTIRRMRRRANGAFLLCLTGVVCAFPGVSEAHLASPRQQQQPAPIERRPPLGSSTGQPVNGANGVYPSNAYPGEGSQRIGPLRRQPNRPPRGEHLAEWMSQHSNLSPQQQQQALEREPGFHDLSRDTQQRMQQRLSQLNAVSPLERQRLLARNEAMERLSPTERADVRGAMGQLGNLPMDQRRMVARTFRNLRDLPTDQRVPALSSGRFGQQLNDVQRAALYRLLQVEPLLPPPAPRRRDNNNAGYPGEPPPE